MKKISFAADILPMKNLLYRLALRITMNREEAEDIVQDTLIKVWNKRDDWDNIESIEAFSMTVCRNLALDRMKRAEHLNTSLEQENIDSADRSRSPLELMEQRDRVETVRRLGKSNAAVCSSEISKGRATVTSPPSWALRKNRSK